MQRRIALVGLLLGVLLVTTGCLTQPVRSAPTDAHDAAEGTIPISRFASSPGDLAARAEHQHLDWFACAEHTSCAVFHAPLDWWHDTGKKIDVFVARHRATGKRLGALVVDPGGPGQSGSEMIAAGVDGVVSDAIAEHYDVIGLDPRGVGGSTSVRCGGAKRLDALLYGRVAGEIGSDEWIAGTRARSAAFADACRARSGALLDHIDGLSVARDLELLRALLGEKRLDYLGYSYGTYLGTLYAGMFPEHVGRMVLDGVLDPWYGGSGDEDADQTAGFAGAFDAYLDACLDGDAVAVGSRSCPLEGPKRSADREVEGILDRLRAEPLTVGDRTLTDALLVTAVDEALYDPASWPRLSRALEDVEKGSGHRALRLVDEYFGRDASGYWDNGNEAFLAVNCLEYGSAVDLKADREGLADLRHQDPVLGEYRSYGDLACAGWHVGPSAFPAPVRAEGAAPILLIGTTGDPATPYPQARALAKRLASGHLLTLVGEGHTAYALGHSCIDRRVDAYLLHGELPPRGTRCR